ncbi:MAG: ATP-binding protein [Deltaproteobacteria bacterium]|nr:ATP-binding protein [Deltaproteobacteria bacterium]
MKKTSEITNLLQELKLKGMTRVIERELARADKLASPLSEVLIRLLTEEKGYRRERSFLYRLKKARLAWPWTLDSFPFDLQPGVSKMQIMGLSGLGFMERAENIVFIGDPGAGKTGLAMGLLRQAITSGYHGRFFKAQELLDELYASLADRSSARLLKSLSAYDILVIDELGYLTLNSEQVNAFFKLMEERYNKKSTIITTNLDYPQWYDLFGRKSLVDALLDRLHHHCITIRINGPSLRTKDSQNPNQKNIPKD